MNYPYARIRFSATSQRKSCLFPRRGSKRPPLCACGMFGGGVKIPTTKPTVKSCSLRVPSLSTPSVKIRLLSSSFFCVLVIKNTIIYLVCRLKLYKVLRLSEPKITVISMDVKTLLTYLRYSFLFITA